MWAFLFVKLRTKDFTDDMEIGALRQELGAEPIFTHLGRHKIFAAVAAGVNDDQAATIAGNDGLLSGSAKLLWIEPCMIADIKRTIAENETDPASPRVTVRKIDLSKPEDLGDKLELLQMLLKTMPDDDPDKQKLQKLQELLRQHAETCKDPDCQIPRV
jgi:hypothetical protein